MNWNLFFLSVGAAENANCKPWSVKRKKKLEIAPAKKLGGWGPGRVLRRVSGLKGPSLTPPESSLSGVAPYFREHEGGESLKPP